MGAWKLEQVFKTGEQFVAWLDKNYGDYIDKHISALHVHCTDSPTHDDNKKRSTLELSQAIRRYHMNVRGWSDIAEHTTLGLQGDVVLGRDITRTPASAAGSNGSRDWHPFMFEMIGDFDKGRDTLGGVQLETVLAISRYFHKKGKPIKFHRELPGVAKTCPGSAISKDWFMGLVKEEVKEGGEKEVPKSSYKGNSIVDYLISLDKDYSKEAREQYAKEYGVNGYDFSAEKNLELLAAMRKGKPKPQPKDNGKVYKVQIFAGSEEGAEKVAKAAKEAGFATWVFEEDK